MGNAIFNTDQRGRRKSAAIQAAFFLLTAPIAIGLLGCAASETPRADFAEPAPNANSADKPASASASPRAFAYVHPAWHEERDFKRVSEYFTAEENFGGDIVLRSTPEVRRGFYFQIGFPFGAKFPAGSTLQIEYRRGDERDLVSRTFQLPQSPTNPFFEIRAGLTGSHWETAEESKRANGARKKRPVAWRITLRTPDGQIWQNHSFLWELPKSNLARVEASQAR